MKLATTTVLLTAITLPAFAGPLGTFRTDRFGYDAVVTEYATLADAQNGTNAIGSVNLNDRDISLRFSNGNPDWGSDQSGFLGSWYYTTEANTEPSGSPLPKDDPAGNRYYSGWGNVNGNTGAGFIQMWDPDLDTQTSIDYAFANFDGLYWTEFVLSVSGSDAGSSEFSRFTVVAPNLDDSGIHHEWDLIVTATGLEGLETAPGVIEAFDHPDAVTGTLSGIFENNDPDDASKNGFFVYELTLNMDNWAFAQGDAALNGNFADSYFATVPEPTSLALLGLGGLMAVRRRRA